MSLEILLELLHKVFMPSKAWAINKIMCYGLSMFHLMGSLLQEDSVKTGKVTAAGMYFLGFPVYRFEQNNLVSWQDWLSFLLSKWSVCGSSPLKDPIIFRQLLQRILMEHSLKDWIAFNHVTYMNWNLEHTFLLYMVYHFVHCCNA